MQTTSRIAFLLVALFPLSLSLAQQASPITEQQVDDKKIQRLLFSECKRIQDSGESIGGRKLVDQLTRCPTSIELEAQNPSTQDKPSTYSRCRQSTVVIGKLFDCGKCNNAHLGTSGGVILSSDGLVLTNYHCLGGDFKEGTGVFGTNQELERVFNFVVMDHAGKMYPVTEIVAADSQLDLALVRIKANDLVPARIANTTPEPLSELFVISHPHDHYYVTTTGIVSRYSTHSSELNSPSILEITAFFAQGSSGCGVFNQSGELIGLVSRKKVVSERRSDKKPEKLMETFKCVALSGIQKLTGITQTN